MSGEAIDDTAEVEVPAGSFLMGRSSSDLFASPAEQPQREVTLSAFAIDVHPVTNRRFRAFLDARGYEDSQLWSREGWQWLQRERVDMPRSFEHHELARDDQPACGLSYFEAEACARFFERRLPTSAEWERVARGTDGRPFPWGDAFPRRDLCNFAGQVGRPSPIGRYPAGVSPLGLHDCAGNVNNWVADVFWEGFGAWCLAAGRLVDPLLTPELAQELGQDPTPRVDRGGGFLTALSELEVLSTTRPLSWNPGARHLWNGFRTAASIGP